MTNYFPRDAHQCVKKIAKKIETIANEEGMHSNNGTKGKYAITNRPQHKRNDE